MLFTGDGAAMYRAAISAALGHHAQLYRAGRAAAGRRDGRVWQPRSSGQDVGRYRMRSDRCMFAGLMRNWRRDRS